MTKTPRGIRNNNPLNIRKGSNWQGLINPGTDKSFCQFVSMELGIRAGFKLLKNYISGYGGKTIKYDTVEKIINRWAPPSENQTSKYAKFVSERAGIPLQEKLQFTDIKKMMCLVEAMIYFENGQSVDKQLIESAYHLV